MIKNKPIKFALITLFSPLTPAVEGAGGAAAAGEGEGLTAETT